MFEGLTQGTDGSGRSEDETTAQVQVKDEGQRGRR